MTSTGVHACFGAFYPHGTLGQQLLRFAGTIPLDDVRLMREAIEQGSERILDNSIIEPKIVSKKGPQKRGPLTGMFDQPFFIR